jgi:hypothetical protein
MMSTSTRTLKFKTLDGRSFVGNVRDGSATLGSIAAKITAMAGLGSCEMIDERQPDVVLDPNTKLDDLPDTVVMSPELTPA